MNQELDFLGHLNRESQRFVTVLENADGGEPVPTCPDWTTADLLWHLTEVQWFWGQIVIRQITTTEAANGFEELARPTGHAELVSLFKQCSSDLQAALTDNPVDTPAWTWSQDHSVGFIRRRQAHEALIHRVDAEEAVNQRTPLDAWLSADGVDEGLKVMYGGIPPWGAFTPSDGRTIRFELTESPDSWLVTLGTFTGTDPDEGKSYDEPDIGVAAVDDGQPAAATINGRAEDVNCWLWHRPAAQAIERAGDESVLADFDRTIAPGID